MAQNEKIESFEANLNRHSKIAAKMEAAYKQSLPACHSFFIEDVYAEQACARLNEPFLTMLHRSENAEVILKCNFHMDDLIQHWGRAVQPVRTYYAQVILHHISVIVNACKRVTNSIKSR